MRIYSNQLLANVALLKQVLEERGISCEIRREYLSMVSGEVPPIETWPELWILDKSRASEAGQLVHEFLNPTEELTKVWTCPKCHEESEGQFRECWNCQTERPME